MRSSGPPLLVLALLLAACSASAPSGTVGPDDVPSVVDAGALDVATIDAPPVDLGAPPLCTPGAQLACACLGGVQGLQVCTAAGTLGPCACPDAGSPLEDTGVDVPTLGMDAADAGPVDVGVDAPDVPFRCTTSPDCAGRAEGPVCDAASGRCVPCLPADDRCPASQHCDAATLACAPGCRSDEGCPGGHCDTSAHACVACVNDDHCPVGSLCVGNLCVTGCTAARACLGGQSCCSGACVDTRTNVGACGACDARCSTPNGSSACLNGLCAVGTCAAPYANCDGAAANGCETNTQSDAAHCGGCATNCGVRPNAAARCTAGACAYDCAAGFADCDGLASNGCEVDTRTSPTHCGGCATACTAAHTTPGCVSGTCTVNACATGYGDCDGNGANGCETNTNSSTAHCGSCATTCVAAPNTFAACGGGTCALVCATGFGDCDSLDGDGCEIDVRTSTANCGACGRACASGQTCVASTCTGPACTNDAIRCNAAGTGVERCVSGAWSLIRTCTTTLPSAGSNASCYLGGCVSCAGVDGGATCGASTCRTDDDCYRVGWARCVDGRCARRGILPCVGTGTCGVWSAAGQTYTCTLDSLDLNGASVRSCTGDLVGPCTADHQCPRGYVCDLHSGVCASM